MIQRFQTACPDCNGEGEIIRDKDRCKKCKGKKTVIERKVLHVPVDRGIPNGHKINFDGEGDQIPGVQPGDVVFEIEEKEHPRFHRRGDDLVHTAKIHLYTALAGGIIHIQHLDNKPRWLVVNIYPGEVITPGQVKMIRGAGMPSFRHQHPGNMYINFEVEFPRQVPHMTGEDKAMLKGILGLPAIPPQPRTSNRANGGMELDVEDGMELDVLTTPLPRDVQEDEVDLEEIDQSGASRAARATMDEDDEDGVPAGAERMQCASQ